MEKKPKSRGLSNLKLAGSDLQEATEKIKEKNYEFSTENNIVYSFYGDVQLVVYLKRLRLSRNTDPDFYHYSESDAVREGIKLLQKAFPNITQRPSQIHFSGKVGRGKTKPEEVKKVRTSFTISESDQEFINNFIYERQKGGERVTKEAFFAIMIEHLENKYKLNENT